MYSPASSPGPSYSERGLSPKKGGFLDSLKRGLSSGRPESPTSSLGGSEVGTPKSRMFPSFTNGQRKRDIIKKLEEDMSLQNLQVHQQDAQIAKLQQQVQQEEAAKIDARETLNMQYFKASLLVDMLVMKLLDIEQQQDAQQLSQPVKAVPLPTAAAVQPTTASQAYAQKAAAPAGASLGAAGGTTVLEESSFD